MPKECTSLLSTLHVFQTQGEPLLILIPLAEAYVRRAAREVGLGR